MCTHIDINDLIIIFIIGTYLLTLCMSSNSCNHFTINFDIKSYLLWPHKFLIYNIL